MKHVIYADEIRVGGVHHNTFLRWMAGDEIEQFNTIEGVWKRDYSPTFSPDEQYRSRDNVVNMFQNDNHEWIDGITTGDMAALDAFADGRAEATGIEEVQEWMPGSVWMSRGGKRYMILIDKRKTPGMVYNPDLDPDGKPLIVMSIDDQTVALRTASGHKHNGRSSELDLTEHVSESYWDDGLFKMVGHEGILYGDKFYYVGERRGKAKPCVAVNMQTGECRLLD